MYSSCFDVVDTFTAWLQAEPYVTLSKCSERLSSVRCTQEQSANAMAMMDTRHRWVVARLANILNLDTVVVETALAASDCLGALDQFLQQSGLMHLIFSCEMETESRVKIHLVDAKFHAIRGKTVYFVRVHPGPVSISTIQTDVIFGVINKGALRSLHALLNDLYLQHVQLRTDWGVVDADIVREFVANMRKFVVSLNESIGIIDKVIELRKPESPFLVENKPSALAKAAQDDELIHHYEEILTDWIEQTESLLAESELPRQVRDEDGPETELDYWNKRKAKFSTIVEQLKTPACKLVINLFQMPQAKKGPIRKWRLLDNALSDAANEAIENHRFLVGLGEYMKTLYSGTPITIAAEVPGLLNRLKMMHSASVARHYSSAERMTTLLAKITNQMIINCRTYLLSGGKSLWEQDPLDIITRLEVCISLEKIYHSEFRSLRDNAMATGKGKPLDLSELHIFGKFEQFCKRATKLMELFKVIKQFRSLATFNVDGMDKLVKAFEKILGDMRNKKYDILDYSNLQFDKGLFLF